MNFPDEHISIVVLMPVSLSIQVPSHAAGIAVAPDGKHVYVTNRGHDSVAAFSIKPDVAKGEGDVCLVPTAQVTVPSGGRLPWTITFITNTLLVVSNQYLANEDAFAGRKLRCQTLLLADKHVVSLHALQS
jgi:6-phosphogluconolactonase